MIISKSNVTTSSESVGNIPSDERNRLSMEMLYDIHKYLARLSEWF